MQDVQYTMILNIFFKMSMEEFTGEFGEAVSSFIGDTANPGLVSVLKILSMLLVVSTVTRGIFWFGFNRNWTAILTLLGIAGVITGVFYFMMVELPASKRSQFVIS